FGENWEMFLRIGAGSTRATDSVGTSTVHIHDVDSGYAVGFGTKWNFCRPSDKLKIGGIFQVLWSEMESEAKIAGNKWTTNTDLMEMQFAVGPEYKIRDNISLYGGAFFNIVDGDLYAKRKNAAGKITYDIKQNSVVGGFVGSRITINDGASLGLEWQHTKSMTLLGINLVLALN
ncbi:MAG: outer membrane beta-barrel protein, partial [Phycisphaerae bacterium]|nr:outer membrane beta-barrel protein [Phycisphaerae bacterium]